ncbi:RING finger protein 39 [Ornithorhynchus anatinus]|uniref:Ring finger protein 39 n=1 Tax=Ornithorhynchus anatinus TaxID=9258 RepID=A0A6I8NTB4_ORNAN|nr:RING finger protein 39 [Ornithorhynchus anatinus]
MDRAELGKGLVAQLERLSTCPLCGAAFQDPVLLDCDHSFCRRCVGRWWDGQARAGAGLSCPGCGHLCPRRSLRTNVRLAVEVRISRGLRDRLGDAGSRAGRRRGGRIPTMGSQDPQGEDVRKTWRRFEITKPKPVESDDETTEDYPVAKNMLHRLSVDLTLDPATAHRCLLLSPDRRSVRLGDPGVPAPADGPRRFDQLLGVLAAQGFEGGRHCWEVETVAEPGEGEDEGGRYALGAAGESVRRKGRVGLCPASGVWAVERSGGRLWALTAPEATPLQGRPRRIRVDVDWERGRVAFYDGLSLDLLYAFQGPGPFGERVFPFFCTLDPHTPLRLVPTEG